MSKSQEFSYIGSSSRDGERQAYNNPAFRTDDGETNDQPVSNTNTIDSMWMQNNKTTSEYSTLERGQKEVFYQREQTPGASEFELNQHKLKEEAEEKERLKGRKIFTCIMVIFILLIIAGALICIYFFVIKEKDEVPNVYDQVSRHFNLRITLQQEWNDSLSNINSQQYKTLDYQIIAILYAIFSKKYGSDKFFLDMHGFNKGSIIIQVGLYTSELKSIKNITDVYKQGIKDYNNSQNITLIIDPKDIVVFIDKSKFQTTGRPTSPKVTTLGYKSTTLPTQVARNDSCAHLDSPMMEAFRDFIVERCGDTPAYVGPGLIVDINKQIIEISLENSMQINYDNWKNNFIDKLVAKDKCHSSLKEYFCATAFPRCYQVGSEIKVKPVCRSWCKKVLSDCGFPVVSCTAYPDDDDPNTCIADPSEEEEGVGQGGVVNSADLPAPGCIENLFKCDGFGGGGELTCLDKKRVCDGVNNCALGSDEMICGDEVSNFSCDFDDTMCQYKVDQSSSYAWQLTRGKSLSKYTGPWADHTNLKSNMGGYMMAEASSHFYMEKATFSSPLMVANHGDYCLRFYYFLRGDDVKQLSVYVMDESSLDGPLETSMLWRKRGATAQSTWHLASVNIPASRTTVNRSQVVFEAVRGASFRSDVAVDDVNLLQGKCTYSPAHTGKMCNLDEFACFNGACINKEKQCDRVNDCDDLSDEFKCECTPEEFKCRIGNCIPIHMRCNGHRDCVDQSDEFYCDNECESGNFRCNSTSSSSAGKCIQRDWKCDGEQDCKVGNDESNCDSVKCGVGEFQCSPGVCISEMKVCDGVKDCDTGSDETICVRESSENQEIEMRSTHLWFPVCDHNIPDEFGYEICEHLNHSPDFMLRSTVDSTPDQTFMVFNNTKKIVNDQFTSYFSRSSKCPMNKVISVICRKKLCGFRGEAPSKYVSYIINGESVSSNRRWPWQAGIIHVGPHRNNFKSICGATLISEWHVITAAHCINAQSPDNFKVKLGTKFNKESLDTDTSYDVQSVQMHEDFIYFIYGEDLAILTLKKKVNFTSTIRPICLPPRRRRSGEMYEKTTSSLMPDVGPSSLCYIAGFGLTNPKSQVMPMSLQESKVKLYSAEKCNKIQNTNSKIVCAGYPDNEILGCIGDSGGPLMCLNARNDWTLVGVFSYTTNMCSLPGGYTNAYSFAEWIRDKVDGIASIDCDFTYNNCHYDGFNTAPLKPGYSYFKITDGRANRDIGAHFDSMYDIHGGFLQTVSKKASVHWPRFNRTTVHCLVMNYYLRHDEATWMQFIKASKASEWQRIEQTAGTWKLMTFDLPAGSYHMSMDVKSEKWTRFAIDDVHLVQGTCATASDDALCPAKTTACPSDTAVDSCQPTEDVCELPATCKRSNCNDELNDYTCYFDNSECHFLASSKKENELLFDSDRDWTYLAPNEVREDAPQNTPRFDMLLGCYYANMIAMKTTEVAVTRLPVRLNSLDLELPLSHHYNLEFYFNVSSDLGRLEVKQLHRVNGVLKVKHSIVLDKSSRFIIDTDITPGGDKFVVWQKILIRVDKDVEEILFEARTTAFTTDTNYVSIDTLKLNYEIYEVSNKTTSPAAKSIQHPLTPKIVSDASDVSIANDADSTSTSTTTSSSEMTSATTSLTSDSTNLETAPTTTTESSTTTQSINTTLASETTTTLASKFTTTLASETTTTLASESTTTLASESTTTTAPSSVSEAVAEATTAADDEVEGQTSTSILDQLTTSGTWVESNANATNSSNDAAGNYVFQPVKNMCGIRPKTTENPLMSYIIGGEKAMSWPWVAYIRVDGVFLCSASVISDRKLISAAHCFDKVDEERSTLTVVLKSTYIKHTRNEYTLNIKSITIPEAYDAKTNYINDIVIIDVEEKIDLKEVNPICLPEANEVYDRCILTGWGTNQYNQRILVEELQQADMKLVSRQDCDLEYPGMIDVERHVCAISQSASACFGDSGAGLMCSSSGQPWILVGVLSFGDTSCGQNINSPKKPAGYTSVLGYAQWIKAAGH